MLPKRSPRDTTPGELLIISSQLTPEFSEFTNKVMEVSATAINTLVEAQRFYADVDHSNFTENEHQAWLIGVEMLAALEVQFDYVHNHIICTLAHRALIIKEVNDPTVIVPEEGPRKDVE
jgi:hypothetical protein